MAKKQSYNYNPRHAQWNDLPIDQWQPAKWKQWKPKSPASDRTAKIEREYLRIKHAINQANLALNLDRVKVKLKLTSTTSIALQGTFPCKPGDTGKNNASSKQYTISLGFTTNDIGVKTAIAKARELDLLLITNKFEWTSELLGKHANPTELKQNTKPKKLIRDLIQEYKHEFWKTHEQNRQGLRTWETHYLRHLKKLPTNVALSSEALEEALKATKPHTSSRFYSTWQLKKFCDFCKFDDEGLIDSYVTPPPKPKIRKIPNDEEIIRGFSQIGMALSPYVSKDNVALPDQWQWVYGMLAAYGLRPHELFAIDLDAFTDPKNTFHLVKLNPYLTGGTKTGERTCGMPPLYPHWVDLFKLKEVKVLTAGGSLSNQTAKIQIRFRNTNIGFQPYDLRHAYALRGHRLRIPIKTMSDYMGHTVQEHTKTYQRWMNEDTNLEIYKEVVIHRQGTTKEALKSRIAELEAENFALKAENESLKGILVQHQLGEILK